MPVSFFFFSSRRRHTRWPRDWSSDVCSSDLIRASTASLTGLTADSSFEVGCAFIPGQVHTPTEVPTGGAGLAIVRSDRSEERRVGKEGREGGRRREEKQKDEDSTVYTRRASD